MQVTELQAELIATENETKVRYLIVLESNHYRRFVEIDGNEFSDLCHDLKQQLLISGKTKAVISEQITKIKYFVK